MKKEPFKRPGSKRQFNSYLKYSNLAFQMGLTIALGVWGGIQLDRHFNSEKPIFTIIFSLLGVFLAMGLVIYGVMKKKKEE